MRSPGTHLLLATVVGKGVLADDDCTQAYNWFYCENDTVMYGSDCTSCDSCTPTDVLSGSDYGFTCDSSAGTYSFPGAPSGDLCITVCDGSDDEYCGCAWEDCADDDSEEESSECTGVADNVEDDAFIEAYGYRSQCPRLSTNWVNVIVNQREAPDECDLQVTTMDHFDKLGERNPRFIVVPQAYALAWRENGKKQGFPLQDAFLDFFSELEAGTMGYIERERFLPFFSSLVGLSQNQRHIPEIVVYEKIEKS